MPNYQDLAALGVILVGGYLVLRDPAVLDQLNTAADGLYKEFAAMFDQLSGGLTGGGSSAGPPIAAGPGSFVIRQTRNDTAKKDFRWSKNVNFGGRGYEATVYATLTGIQKGAHIGLKHWGPNHTPPCGFKLGNKCCCWYDSGVREGRAYLQIERPHPNNFDKPCPTCFPVQLVNGRMIGIKWRVVPQAGGVRLSMWIDNSGRQSNAWRLAYDIVDRGQILPNYKAPAAQEIEMRISDVNNIRLVGGGLIVRRL